MKMVDVVSKTHEHYVLFCGAMHISVPIRVAQRVCVCVHVLSVGSNKEFGKVPARKFPSRPTWLPCAVHELAALLLTCAVTAPSKVLLLTCAVMPVEGFRLGRCASHRRGRVRHGLARGCAVHEHEHSIRGVK